MAARVTAARPAVRNRFTGQAPIHEVRPQHSLGGPLSVLLILLDSAVRSIVRLASSRRPMLPPIRLQFRLRLLADRSQPLDPARLVRLERIDDRIGNGEIAIP